MKKAAVVYQSRTGTTRAFAEAIAEFLSGRGIQARAVSVADATPQVVSDADYVLLGCWTGGLIVMLQHPDRVWIDFARKLPSLKAERVGLFTTYKVATGGMFKKMAACLTGKATLASLELKSRNGALSDQHKQAIERFLAA